MCTNGILAQIVASLAVMNEHTFVYSFRSLSTPPEMNAMGIMANTSILYAVFGGLKDYTWLQLPVSFK